MIAAKTVLMFALAHFACCVSILLLAQAIDIASFWLPRQR